MLRVDVSLSAEPIRLNVFCGSIAPERALISFTVAAGPTTANSLGTGQTLTDKCYTYIICCFFTFRLTLPLSWSTHENRASRFSCSKYIQAFPKYEGTQMLDDVLALN